MSREGLADGFLYTLSACLRNMPYVLYMASETGR